MHIYDELILSCFKLNQSLTKLAKMYPTVKFCRVQAQHLSLSQEFLEKGLPALLIYKGGDMIGNFLNISSQIGEECLINDVEGFLQDNKCLPSDPEAKMLSPYNVSPRHSATKHPLSDTDDDQ